LPQDTSSQPAPEIAVDTKGASHTGDGQFPQQFRMSFHECLPSCRLAGPANQIRHVEGEEIASLYESVQRLEIDVIRVHVVGLIPPQRAYRFIGRCARAGRSGTDNGMFPVRFVPHRNNLYSQFVSHPTGLQLRLGLPSKPVAHTDRVFGQ